MKPKRALICDEREVAGILAESACLHHGYEVEFVTKANQALRKLRQGEFDLLFVNFKANPSDYCKRVQRLMRRAKGVNHVVCTFTGETDLRGKLRRKGYNVIRKPFRDEDMKELIGDISNTSISEQ